MAFLYHVLKDVSEKQPYSVGKDMLRKDVVKVLEGSLCTGHKGFKEVIVSVVKGGAKYNSHVKSSNAVVRHIITRLSETVEPGVSTTIEKIPVDEIDKMPPADLKKQVKEIGLLSTNYVKYGDAFEKGMVTFANKIENLNKDLKVELVHVRKNIAHETKRLGKISKKERDNYSAMMKIVAKIEEIKTAFTAKVKEAVTRLVNKLKEDVRKILTLLEQIDEKLRSYARELLNWMQEADGFAGDAIKMIDKILDEVDNSSKIGHKKAIGDVATAIRVQAVGLHNQFSELNEKYAGLVTKINGLTGKEGVVKELNEVNNTVTEPKDFRGFTNNGGENTWDVSEKIKPLMDKIKKNVGDYLEDLKRVLEAGIEEADSFKLSTIPGLNAMVDSFGGQLLAKLGTFGGLLTSAKAAKLSGELGYCFENVLYYLKSIKTKQSGGWGTFAERTSTELKSSMQTKAAGIDDELGSLLQAAAIKGVENLHEAVKKIVREKLQPITHDAGSLIAAAQEAEDELQQKSYSIINNLNLLCKAVKDAAETDPRSLRATLYELRRKIGWTVKVDEESLHKLHGKLTTLLTGDMQNAIRSADRFIKPHADKAGEHVIKELTQEIESKLTYANTQLTTKTHQHYFCTMKDLLKTFADKVRTELRGLPQAIDEELEQGYKKFMKTFGETFVNKINGIKDVDSYISAIEVPQDVLQKYPLGKASRMLDEAFRGLFEELSKQTDFTCDFEKVKDSKDSLAKLLEALTSSEHFDHTFSNNLDELKQTISALGPSKFGDAKSPLLLESLKGGLSDFIKELKNAYVSSYSGALCNEKELVHYAKISLTITPIVYDALTQLKDGLERKEGKRKTYKIYDPINSQHNLHKLFFRDNGYGTGLPDDAVYGELNHRDGFNGTTIYNHLTNSHHMIFTSSDAPATTDLISDIAEIPVEYAAEDGAIHKLHCYLGKYIRVRHLTNIPKPRSPCNIYEMLQWCCGLQFNSVYDELHKHCASLFGKKKDSNTNTEISLPIKAYPKSISRDHVDSAIHHITSRAYFLLTGILGHGDAECGYACELSDNSLHLKYPTSGADCLHTLLDILRRLFPALQFLQRRCSDASADFGWGDCLYGKGIHTSNTLCNEHSTNEVTCQANCKANSQPDCQPTSPLMCYLNDCLPGHLPHQLIDVGCQSTCKTCPNNLPGQPCITPIGFRGFSSSVKTGRDLRDMIHEFFDHEHLPALFCLMAKPPSTLPEHFEFARSLVRGWQNPTMSHRSGIKQAVESSIGNQSIDLYKNPGDLTAALTRCYGADCSNCEHSHFTNLTSSGYCSRGGNVVQRAPYLSSLCSNTYLYLAEKHSNAYLSWAIYLPWNFHKYLEMLLQAFSEIFCGDWGCRSCLKSANCKRGKHGHSDKDEKTKTVTPYCRCTSVVTCRGVAPTLYSYGFSFADTSALNEEETRKTCTNFYDSLKEVINSQRFTDLFNECDMFLWRIREPFSYLVLALWSLSLFYLIHIMVIRLDLLHIKSHLHSPSSHRIAAQSLLAAGRVNKLGRVFYLQP